LTYVIHIVGVLERNESTMTNRTLYLIVKDQTPLMLYTSDTVKHACELMAERKVGSVLVVDTHQRLVGIFTGRDVVRVLSKGDKAGELRLSKAMTRNPETISPDARALDALKAMEDRGFRHLPVMENERIWGVVAKGDFKGMEFENLSWAGEHKTSHRNRGLAQILGNQKPATLLATDTVGQACQIMTKRKSGSVAVTDKRGKLTGIFTGRDAIRVLAKEKSPSSMPLSKAMSRNPTTIESDCTAIEALRTMCDGCFRHLPVVENGKLLGVVSRSDFTGCEIDRLEEEEHLYECLR
jgi:CBS domain-containing protein